MISACKSGSAKSITGALELQSRGAALTPMLSANNISTAQTNHFTSCNSIFPLLPPVKEEVSPRRHHRPHDRKSPPRRRRDPRHHNRPARQPNARLLPLSDRQPLRRASDRQLDPHERRKLQESSRRQQESRRHEESDVASGCAEAELWYCHDGSP